MMQINLCGAHGPALILVFGDNFLVLPSSQLNSPSEISTCTSGSTRPEKALFVLPGSIYMAAIRWPAVYAEQLLKVTK